MQAIPEPQPGAPVGAAGGSYSWVPELQQWGWGKLPTPPPGRLRGPGQDAAPPGLVSILWWVWAGVSNMIVFALGLERAL